MHFNLDWQSSKSEILINPRLPEEEKQCLLKGLSDTNGFKGHIWLTTSGSSGALKWVGLSKNAFLASAKAVNDHLQSNSKDIWLNILPIFHVGSLSIWARGYLSGAKVAAPEPNWKWSPKSFVDEVIASQATCTSLVPTQVYDLVSQGFTAPQSLRAVIVGGGALHENLYFEAIAKGWKLLPSYGLTECASQVATADIGTWEHSRYPLLTPLNHVTLELNEEGFLNIKSPALLSAYIFVDKMGRGSIVDPKVDGWFTSEDKVSFEHGKIKHVTRGSLFVKIGGENVDLLRLENILEKIKLELSCQHDMALIAVPDERLGHVIHLAATEHDSNIIDIVERFSTQVLPFEKIRSVHKVDQIPRSPLGKVLRQPLTKLLLK